MRATIERSSPIVRTPRVAQLEGMFDLPPSQRSAERWEVELPIEAQPWHVGLVVGPSGSGKSTLLRELWPERIVEHYDWPEDRSVVDGFPRSLGTREVVELLNSVGFSSPPSWLRPFAVLSTGERFRAHVARALAEGGDLVVLDEYTSVVDRTVAQIGSAAIGKAVRRRGTQLIVATCHYDVEDWLQPEWVYQPHVGELSWRSVQPRPPIDLDVHRCGPSAWQLFGPHHYLSDQLNRSAACWVGLWRRQPVVFLAVLPQPHAVAKNVWRAHRLVTLPDFQGVGIGNRFCDYIAGVYKAAGRRLTVTTAHPARVGTLARNRLWTMRRAPGMTAKTGRTSTLRPGHQEMRLTASFEYVGPAVDSPLAAEVAPRAPAPATRPRPRSTIR